MAVPPLFRRDPAGTGVAFGLLAAAGFLLAPAVPPLLLALALLLLGTRPASSALQGLGVGALIGLAAAKGLLETAGHAVALAPWIAAVAAAAVPLVLGRPAVTPDADFI